MRKIFALGLIIGFIGVFNVNTVLAENNPAQAEEQIEAEIVVDEDTEIIVEEPEYVEPIPTEVVPETEEGYQP